MSQPPQTDDAASACPVDHKTRSAWLAQAKSQKPASEGCDSSAIAQASPPPPNLHSSLANDRQISSIPRVVPSLSETGASRNGNAAARPANNEIESGADKQSGNWIYPSEQMFFNAMKRKSYNPDETDMKTIVPIHNAVNERAWKEIKEWEKGRGADSCGGPRLESFSGLSSALTPRARLNVLLGYQPPFDRHDWTVDRCGTKVEYVIDFYAGKDEKKAGKELNFYLDVRPKLNTFEGWRTRAMRFVGL